MNSILRNDLCVIIELTEILDYTINNYNIVTSKLSNNEIQLIRDLSSSIEKYKESIKSVIV